MNPAKARHLAPPQTIDHLGRLDAENAERWAYELAAVERLSIVAFAVLQHPTDQNCLSEMKTALHEMGYCTHCECRPCECGEDASD